MVKKRSERTVEEAFKYASSEVSEFLEKNKEKNFAILYDDDPDGISASVLFEKILDSKNINVLNTIYLSETLRPFEKKFNGMIEKNNIHALVIIDISISGFGYLESFKEFQNKYPDLEIMIIDHHSDETDYTNTLYLNSHYLQNKIEGHQVCCSKFIYEIGKQIVSDFEKYSWIASIGIIGDMNHKTWNQDILDAIKKYNGDLKNDKKEIILPENLSDYTSTPYGECSKKIFYGVAKNNSEIDSIRKNYVESKYVFSFLEFLKKYDGVEEEIEDYIDNYKYFTKFSTYKKTDVNVFELEVKSEYNIEGILANIISSMDDDTIFFIYHKHKDNYVYISLRLQNEKIDLGKLIQKCIDSPHTNGGGHAPAAGARVPKDHFKELKAKFYEELGKVKTTEKNEVDE